VPVDAPTTGRVAGRVVGINALTCESSIATALEFFAGCVAGEAAEEVLDVALALALGAKDCGLSVAGK